MHSESIKESIKFLGLNIWGNLVHEIKQLNSLKGFKKATKHHVHVGYVTLTSTDLFLFDIESHT